ncbi:DMT family transporter [Pseudonocardia benzenivorans]|jgi:small multidrug resistance pump|uniref:Small multidrug resistance protein n=2 Tax=Pseudonocardia TaxID=1847 RepID=F4CXN0_PSEUX|nr:multidrug efflux SMR transporter [Pseudonocardia dioxanivorans]AEA27613.1 small multidrug resistance protein [Pseudonocardia dioxanivorans CB1190]GJF05565.1 QacE family quaternary ammonium compound efflux SMR transporter [Pseudonocardia sp. D17]
MAWLWLLGAIATEVVATTSLKLSDGFSRLVPSVVVVLGYVGAFVLLAQALKRFEVGTAYALWSGIGTAAVVLIGVLFLGEGLSLVKAGGVLLIIGGVVLLNLSGGH